MNEVELKPCPYCGSQHIYGEEVGKGIRTYRVECWCCGASVESVNSAEKVIEWWNTRTIDRDELLAVANECEQADVDGVVDWAARIRRAVGE